MNIFAKINNLKTHIWANILAGFGFLSLINFLCFFDFQQRPGSGDILAFLWFIPQIFMLISALLISLIAFITEKRNKFTITSSFINKNKFYTICFWLGFLFFFAPVCLIIVAFFI